MMRERYAYSKYRVSLHSVLSAENADHLADGLIGAKIFFPGAPAQSYRHVFEAQLFTAGEIEACRMTNSEPSLVSRSPGPGYPPCARRSCELVLSQERIVVARGLE